MRSVVTAIIFTITCAPPLSAQVIDYILDTPFNTGDFYSRGIINEIVILEEQGYLVSGYFNHGATTAKGTTIVGFSGEEIFNGSSQTMGSPRILKYREKFLGFGAQVLQWFEPGGTDYSFRFEFQKQAYSGPLSNKALDAMVLLDDHILVAGRFFTDSTLMGTSIASQGLRQLCMIDSTGAPVPDFPMLRCEWPTDSEIYRIAKLNSGDYIISGRFLEVEGHATNHVARLHADFSVDTTFVSPFAFKNSGVVLIQFIDTADRIIATGANAELINDPDTYPGLVRMLPDGSLDPTFQIPEILFVNPPTGIVYDLPPNRVVMDHDGTLIVTGQFHTINGFSRKNITKLTAGGEVIEGIFEDFGTDEAIWGTWEGSPIAGSIVDVGDGKWLIGGQFSSFGGEPYNCLVRLQPNGFVSTEDQERRGKLKIWPNPASTTVRLDLPGIEITYATMYDMQGRRVLDVALQHGESLLDISTLPKGIYLLRVNNVSGGVYVKKLVVE